MIKGPLVIGLSLLNAAQHPHAGAENARDGEDREQDTKCDEHGAGHSLVVVREFVPVGLAFVQEGLLALDGLIGHIGQAGGLAGEDLLAHQAIIGEVEREFQHALGGGGLHVDLLAHADGGVLELAVVCDLIDRAHLIHALGIVGAAQKEDLAGEFLATILAR